MCALLSALAALAAVALTGPVSAMAAPAAIDEYDLALPPDDGPQDPAPTPEPTPDPAPAPVPPPEPTVPAPSDEVAEVAAGPNDEPRRVLDKAAARRDVLFEAPAGAAPEEARALAPPAEQSSLPPALWLLVALGGACIIATLVRLRRFATSLGSSPRPVPSSQTSS